MNFFFILFRLFSLFRNLQIIFQILSHSTFLFISFQSGAGFNSTFVFFDFSGKSFFQFFFWRRRCILFISLFNHTVNTFLLKKSFIPFLNLWFSYLTFTGKSISFHQLGFYFLMNSFEHFFSLLLIFNLFLFRLFSPCFCMNFFFILFRLFSLFRNLQIIFQILSHSTFLFISFQSGAGFNGTFVFFCTNFSFILFRLISLFGTFLFISNFQSGAGFNSCTFVFMFFFR